MVDENTTELTEKQRMVTWKHDVHGKIAASSKAHSFTITMRSLRSLAEKEAQLVQCALRDLENNLVDPNFILELTKTIHGSGEKSISDYILRNKEILLNEHSSVVRRQVIQGMRKKILGLNEQAIRDAEKLEGDVANFMELIENSDRLASESFTRVCEIAKVNEEKTEIVKETEDKVFLLKTEVEKSEQILIEYLMCAAFLDSISPIENEDKGKKCVLPKGFLKCFGKACEISDGSDEDKLTPSDVLQQLLDSGEQFEPMQVPFNSPEEIIKIIESVKDRNLSLVRNSRLSRGSSKDEMKAINETKQKMY